MPSRWSVQLAITEPCASGLMSDPFHVPWTQESLYGISITGARQTVTESESYTSKSFSTDPERYEDPCTFTLEIEAIDARDARIRTQNVLAMMQMESGLPIESAPVVWVAPVANTTESSRRFWTIATDLMEAERFDAAVVMAQTHLEVQIRVIVEMLVAEEQSPLAEAIARRETSWSLSSAWHRDIFSALLGVDVTTFPRWHEYAAHVKRRNAVVHRGLVVEEEEAKVSLGVIEDLWLWLTSAFERATTVKRYPFG